MMDSKINTSQFKGSISLDSVSLDCHVLTDGTRLFSVYGIQKCMGYEGKSENWLYEFISHLDRLMPVDPILLEELSESISFKQTLPNGSIITSMGILPNIFFTACNAILKAKNEGFLFVSELKFAKVAETILSNIDFAEVNNIIDYSTGVELYKGNHKELLSRFLKNHLENNCFIWIKAFPDSFFKAIFDFKDWKWADLNTNTAEVADFFTDTIFSRVSDEAFSELEASKPRMKYRKKNTPQTYLENSQLSAHLHSISTLIKVAEQEENLFTLLLNNAFPKKRSFKSLKSGTERQNETLSQFDQLLIKSVSGHKH